MSAAGQSVMTCWNCEQAVHATATSCLWCGVALQPAVTPIVVAPGGLPAPTASTSPSAARPEEFYPGPSATYSPPLRSPARKTVPLGEAFAGSNSSVGAQVGAFSVDVLAVAVVTMTVHLAVGKTPITWLAVIESLVFLWVLEARTGLTIGNLLFRIRTSRTTMPYSPGAGRAFVRQTILNAGLFCAVAGAWLIAGSGAWDSTGERRSLAAKASGTRAVSLPPKARAVVMHTRAVATPMTSPASYAQPNHAQPAEVHSIPGAAQLPDPALAEPPAPAQSAPRHTLLLVFDTGQRVTVAAGSAINLGRKPSAVHPTDQLVVVDDPEGTVSKFHAKLEHFQGDTWVTDQGSTNGTDLVDEDGVVRLEAGVRTFIPDGARTRIGNRSFTVSVLLESAPSLESPT